MDTDSPIYAELNKSWKSTCRILFGEEIGELKEYEEWLKEFFPKMQRKESSLSGREIAFDKSYYCSTANFISLDEIKEIRMDPLSINEIKDIDSIVESVSEKWAYCGNKIKGNSTNVGLSDNVTDSHYVLESTNVRGSTNVYASTFIDNSSKFIFGCNCLDNSEFMIKCGGYKASRCIESGWIDRSSDLFYCFFCLGCNDLLFSFGQRNKRNCIGNLQLTKEKYQTIKTKLIGEIKEELVKNKDFPGLLSKFIDNNGFDPDIKVPLTKELDEGDFKPIEKEFSATTRIIFKHELNGILDYENWLSRYLVKLPEIKSYFGSDTYRIFLQYGLDKYPEKRIVSQREGVELGKLQMKEEEIQSMDKLRKGVQRIACFIGDMSEKSTNCFKCPAAFFCSDMYRVGDGTHSENCAVDGIILRCKNTFGSNRTMSCQFSINCYNSSTLNRCFEMDNCSNCSDAYFCHNSEGLIEAMFCWNVKAKRHAIGNIELPLEKYKSIKNTLVDQMVEEISKKKSLKYDIFNIGCAKK